MDVRFFDWAKFGALIGLVFGIIFGGLFSLFFGFGTQNALITFFVVVLVFVLASSIGYVFVGIVYDLFLKRFFSGFPVFWQIAGTTIVINGVGGLLMGNPVNLLALVVSGLVGSAIILFIANTFGFEVPFE